MMLMLITRYYDMLPMPLPLFMPYFATMFILMMLFTMIFLFSARFDAASLFYAATDRFSPL